MFIFNQNFFPFFEVRLHSVSTNIDQMIKCMMYCEEKAVAKSILSTYEVKLTTGIKIVTKY